MIQGIPHAAFWAVGAVAMGAGLVSILDRALPAGLADPADAPDAVNTGLAVVRLNAHAGTDGDAVRPGEEKTLP